MKQIRPLLEECKAHGAWAAIHVKGDLSAIFEFAVVRGLVEANPIPSLRGLLRVPFSERKAAMTREQIQRFYQELRGYRGYPETFFVSAVDCADRLPSRGSGGCRVG
ncbi:hypothetical protein L511_0931 [Bordetella bronchiseptica MBORD595]|nr:hypothetical protein L511_0931 [Bordetella bronchiseptica MBORD595]